MTLIGTLFLLCTSVFGSDPRIPISIPDARLKDGFEQSTGEFEINAGAALKGEAFKTLIKKLGSSMLRRPTEDDCRELQAKFIAPYLFGGTRFWVWTKSHWQNQVLVFDDILVESRSGCTATSYLIPPTFTSLYMEINAKTVDTSIEQRASPRPKLSGGVRIELTLKQNPADKSPIGEYLIACPGRFTLPPHGMKVVWGTSYLNYLVDRIRPY